MIADLFGGRLKHGCFVSILEILNSVDILYLSLGPDVV